MPDLQANTKLAGKGEHQARMMSWSHVTEYSGSTEKYGSNFIEKVALLCTNEHSLKCTYILKLFF